MSQLCFQATPLAPSLTFVNATGGKLDKKAKNAVRGHVTRRVFQERRYRKLGQNAEDLSAEKQDKLAASTSTSTTSIPSTPKFVNLDITHVAPKRRCMRRKTEVLVEAADHRFPLLRKMGLKPDLLNKIMTLYGSCVSMEGLYGIESVDQMWSQFMNADPVLGEVTLSYAATHFDRATGFNAQHIPAASQKLKAIQMINSRLPDEKSASLPSTLIAVAIMANVERLSGNLATWRVHLTGLRQLVALRERLHGFVANEWLSQTLSWTFLSSTILYPSETGQWPPQELLNEKPRLQIHVDTPMIIRALRRKNFDSLVPLVEEAHDISTSLHLSPSTPIQHAVPTVHSFTDRILAFQSDYRSQKDPDLLVDSLCTGLAIYVNLVLSSSSHQSPTGQQSRTKAILTTLGSSLQDLIRTRDIRFCHGIELLLWQLFMGAVAFAPMVVSSSGPSLVMSSPSPSPPLSPQSNSSSPSGSPRLDPVPVPQSASSKRRWFTTKLSVIAETLMVKTWQDAERILDGLFWLNDDAREECRIVWDETMEIAARRKLFDDNMGDLCT